MYKTYINDHRPSPFLLEINLPVVAATALFSSTWRINVFSSAASTHSEASGVGGFHYSEMPTMVLTISIDDRRWL